MFGFIKLFFTKKYLKEALSVPLVEESLLGTAFSSVSEEEQKRHAGLILEYGKSEGYKEFSKEMWGMAVQAIAELENAKCANPDFYRGQLKMALDALRLITSSKKYLQILKQNATIRPLQRR